MGVGVVVGNDSFFVFACFLCRCIHVPKPCIERMHGFAAMKNGVLPRTATDYSK